MSLIPDINTDPVGHFRARTEKAEREIADVNKMASDPRSQQRHGDE